MFDSGFDVINSHPCFSSVIACLLLAILYVGSLYMWGTNGLSRDHPFVIKRRMLSVVLVMLLSPLITSYALVDKQLARQPLWEVLGLRYEGLLPAIFLPLLLTGTLFLGPLCMLNYERIFLCDCDWVWLRNYVMAPMSEEWVFRACMLPLWVQCSCWHWVSAVLLCPLTFGVAHAHHIWERMRSGMGWQQAAVLCVFQLGYTTLFGAYSALLFIKTGHVIAPLLAHSFCNMMGFPDVGQLMEYSQPRKAILLIVYLLGIVLWCLLLPILTSTSLYSNLVYKDIIQ